MRLQINEIADDILILDFNFTTVFKLHLIELVFQILHIFLERSHYISKDIRFLFLLNLFNFFLFKEFLFLIHIFFGICILTFVEVAGATVVIICLLRFRFVLIEVEDVVIDYVILVIVETHYFFSFETLILCP